MARFKRKARRTYRALRRVRHRRAMGLGGGIPNTVITGMIVGGGSTLASPYISQYVPPVMGLSPMTVALLGGGAVAKGVLHKGGKWADAAILIGAAQLGSTLAAGGSLGSSTGGMAYY